MASSVTVTSSELASLQSREVGGRPSSPSGRRSSDEDNQFEAGSSSEVDPTESNVVSAASHSARVTVDRRRSSAMSSQYHSISQLSSPSVASSAFSMQSCFDPRASQQLQPIDNRPTDDADSVHVIRGIFHGAEKNQRRDCCVAGAETNGRSHQDDANASDGEDDDDDWAAEQAEMSRDQMSCDDDEYGITSPQPSVDVSMSSIDDLSGADDEAVAVCTPSDLRTRPLNSAAATDTDDVTIGNGNGLQSSSGSDSGSAGDDIIEAKRARMESIVINMRPSLHISCSDETKVTNGTGNGISFSYRDEDPKRRPKRKQYIPKQHDASSELDTSTAQHKQLDSGEETPMAKDRKSLLPTVEKMALEAELRDVSEQLNYIRRKYAHLLDDTSHELVKSEIVANNRGASDCVDGRRHGKCLTDAGWMQAMRGVFNEQHEWNQFITTGHGRLLSPAKQLSDESIVHKCFEPPDLQSSPIAGDTPVDVQRLTELLKMEIAERVESLIDEVIRNFVAKYTLSATSAHHLPSDTEVMRSKFKSESREKSPPEVAVRRSDEVTSGSLGFSENMSPSRDVDDEDRRRSPEVLQSTSKSSFLSVPSLLLPTPPTRPSARATSKDDEDNEAECSGDPLSATHAYCSSDLTLTSAVSSNQTAFEIPPPRTAHHHLFSLFPPHAYYPNASRMAAAAAVAAAAVAAGGGHGYTAAPTPAAIAPAMLFPATAQCGEPEQTEALPLVVNAPTKKKRTKVTDTRLSPRAARSILHDAGHHRHSHHHAASYHAHSHHHPHHQQPQQQQGRSDHRGGVHHGSSSGAEDDRDSMMEHRRSSPMKCNSSADTTAALVSPFIQSRHHSSGLAPPPPPPLPMLPTSLPTSVAVPNPSLQHSDIMSAIFQFSQQRIHHQSAQQLHPQQHLDAAQHQQQQQQRFASSAAAPASFVDKFDLKSLGNDVQTSANEARHASLLSARKTAENNCTSDGYESIYHEDGLVSFCCVSASDCHLQLYTKMPGSVSVNREFV